MNAFLDAKYVICFTGADQGVVQAESATLMQMCIHEIYPNPGCPTRAALCNPSNWAIAHDDFPYFTELETEDERGATVIRVYRVMGLQS